MNTSDKVAVLGAGSWGTALAIQLARSGNQVRLWAHRDEHKQQLAFDRENKRYLPGVSLPDAICIFSDLESCLRDINDILIVVPSTVFIDIIQRVYEIKGTDCRLVWGTKGVSSQDGRLLSDLVADVFGDGFPAAVLSGPSFAREVAQGAPTAVTIAGNDLTFMQDLQQRFHSEEFRVYVNEDFAGVQLCGVIKNVLAIAVGIADGLSLGANARAALITRGVAEMIRLCDARGAQKNTFMGLAGLGDVVLTCTDNLSRNRRFGVALGQGQNTDEIYRDIGQEVEGAHNVSQIYHVALQLGIDMPITTGVYQILHGLKNAHEVVESLMARHPACENL